MTDFVAFILYLVASILKMVLAPFAYIYGFIQASRDRRLNYYHKDLALAKDQYGNALCQYLFNALLIEKNGYKFGNIDETISSVIGKNKRDKTLSKLGKMLDWTLNLFEKNHSIISIDDTVK